MAFNLTKLTTIKGFAPRGLKGVVTGIFQALPKPVNGDGPDVFADDGWNKSKTRQWQKHLGHYHLLV